MLTTMGLVIGWSAESGCRPPNNSHGIHGTAMEYVRMIEPELGVPPKVDCGDGVEIPIYVDGEKFTGDPGIHCCDNPSLQMGDCMSGSSLQRYEGRTREGQPLPHVVWVSFARHDGRDNVFGTDVGDSVQMIGYNKKTGATAFFESGDNSKWTYVDPDTNRLLGKLPWIDEPEAFNRAFRAPGSIQCVECHQADPFIHNPFIDAAKLPGSNEPVVPRIKDDHAPYYVIGASDWDMRTIHVEGNSCLDCHRMGMKTIEEFVEDGWEPNEHMPPRKPGSLKEDFEELLEVWIKGPENVPGAEWIIPPAGDCDKQIVGEDYPYKAEFNKPELGRLAGRDREPRRIPEPSADSPQSSHSEATVNADRVKELSTEIESIIETIGNEKKTDANVTMAATIERFRSEIEARSAMENYRAAQNLLGILKDAIQAGNKDRANVLAVEIELIMEDLGNDTSVR